MTEEEAAIGAGNEKHPPPGNTDHGPNGQKGIVRTLSEEFQRLADRSQDAIYQFDLDSQTFTFFNKLFLEVYGADRPGGKTLSLESVFARVHPDDRLRARAAQRDTIKNGLREGEVDYRIINHDGSIRWVQDKWTITRDADGQAVAIEGFIRDNTRRKQAEDEFFISIQNSPIGCYIVQDAKFVFVNPEFARITGYSESALLGTYPLDIVHPDFRQEVRANFIRMLKRQRYFPYEFQIVDRNGAIKWIAETATPIQFKDRRAGLGYFMDITRRKNAERESLEKEKLEAILELAAAVGHELNNPLQVIVTCSERFKKMVQGDAEGDKLHQLMDKNIQALREKILKIQNITRYAAKDYVQGQKIFDIDAGSGEDLRD
ncbi:MAG: PAS domain S-box protein [Desulfobacteraceae bacterium]|jgi:PAS domain S-box-containing protein|nr:PAS domain S-box protein [Desulfobacteraceae bacterium]